MIAKLNEELQKAVDAHSGVPVEVEHPVTHQRFVLVEQTTHQRAMQALEQQETHAVIQAGLDDMEAGRGMPIEEADKYLREKLGFPEKQ